MPPVRPAVAATLLAALAVLALAGCTDDAGTPRPAAPTATALADVDLDVAVARQPFCDAVPQEAVTAALGGEARRSDTWTSGDRRKVGGRRDVVHEHGCRYRAGRTQAAAWVFAAPTTRPEARALLRERRTTSGCEATGELRFGRRGLVQRCNDGPTTRVVAAGLFGDAWLTCEVTERRAAEDLVERAQRWCVATVYAARAG